MARKITKSVLLSAMLGSGFALGTIGSATASYSQPYPPGLEEEQTRFQHQDEKQYKKHEAVQHQRKHSTVRVDISPREHGQARDYGLADVEELPTTGAPVVGGLAATGAALLLAGSVGMAKAIRQRQTTGGK